ncbi:hypothetical protein [Sphingomonas sp. CROZ-RG-20F-R02-07]|nr:hypothetical protein [Sphingomonas sp. CROZ-RG-20F-R02-07]
MLKRFYRHGLLAIAILSRSHAHRSAASLAGNVLYSGANPLRRT